MAAFAEFESDVRSDYARANRAHFTRLGRPHGGPPPYGYRHDQNSKSFRRHSKEASIVLEIYERFVAGQSSTSIARDLHRRGIPTTQGGYLEAIQHRKDA
jgi:DNA invertase Pin-like site-specific DNA recombinase